MELSRQASVNSFHSPNGSARLITPLLLRSNQSSVRNLNTFRGNQMSVRNLSKNKSSRTLSDEDENSVQRTPVKQSMWLKLPTLLNFGNSKNATPVEVPIITEKELTELYRMKFNYLDRLSLVSLWKQMIGKGHSKLRYSRFLSYLNLKNEVWIRRAFDVMNENLSGSVSFLEFIIFIGKYLYIDRKTTEELCFRLISRRGSTYNAKYSVLDFDDISHFLAFRYTEIDSLPAQRKYALEIFTYMDSDGDGGLDITEFHDFCGENASFLRVSHPLQNHLRRCLFGLEFWVHKSRRVKLSQATGLDALTLPSRANLPSELFTITHIRDPVVDGNGNPIRPQIITADSSTKSNFKLPSSLKSGNLSSLSPSPSHLLQSQLSGGLQSSEMIMTPRGSMVPAGSTSVRFLLERQQVLPSAILGSRPITPPVIPITPKSGQIGLTPSGAPPLSEGEHLLDLDNHRAYFAQQLGENVNTYSYSAAISASSAAGDQKSCLSHRGEFSFASLPSTTFRKDFPQIVKLRNKRRKDKRKLKNSEHHLADALSGAAYDRLVVACSDLIYSRREVRGAFKQWLKAVGLSHPTRGVVVLPNNDKKNFSRRPALPSTRTSMQGASQLLTPCGSVVSGLTMDIALLGGGGGGGNGHFHINNQLLSGEREGTVEDEEELSVDGDDDDDEQERGDKVVIETKEEHKARTRIHHRIVATNQLMQRQSEENCISEYIREYMHDMNTVEWNKPRLEKLKGYQ